MDWLAPSFPRQGLTLNLFIYQRFIYSFLLGCEYQNTGESFLDQFKQNDKGIKEIYFHLFV
jgi:hypothetical protein